VAEQPAQRRLAAIMAADVVGYSRLMHEDEVGTLARLKALRDDVLDPRVAEFHGRVVKTTGDGVLVEFASAVDAVQLAVDVQSTLAERNAGVADDHRMDLRIGVNVGDVIVEGDDIFGDGVNVAARLEAMAEPGRVYVSGTVFDQVKDKVDLAFDDLGLREIKNIPDPVRTYRVVIDGAAVAAASATGPSAAQQDIRFCTAPDGVGIAYATVGSGFPLVKTANWLNHLEYDWRSPVWRHLLVELARDHMLVRYDERGNGLSDWDVEDISFEAFVRDLETVVDAIGAERFALLAISQGCAVAIDYVVRHPERVTHLILYGGYARGRLRRGSATQAEEEEALLTLMRHGWGQENPAFRQIFTSRFIPDASLEQMRWFNDLQRMTTSPENAVRLRRVFDEIEVEKLLPLVSVPTLVLHCRDEAAVPMEEGRRMPARIPGARFVALEGRNHLILEDEPAWPRFLEEVRSFLAGPEGS
jgi:class 3 adenylate cyclase/pimeloyl-ACP methyl ester carboxylesterase